MPSTYSPCEIFYIYIFFPSTSQLTLQWFLPFLFIFPLARFRKIPQISYNLDNFSLTEKSYSFLGLTPYPFTQPQNTLVELTKQKQKQKQASKHITKKK